MLFSQYLSSNQGMMVTKKAFTLIELMVVIAIIGVLAAALYPQIGKYASRGRDAGRITAIANIGSALDSSRFDYDGKYPDHVGGCVPMNMLLTKKYLMTEIISPSGTGYNEGCGNNGQFGYGNLGIGSVLMGIMENDSTGNYTGSTAGFTGTLTKEGILNTLNTKNGAGRYHIRPTNYILNNAIFLSESSGVCGTEANTCKSGVAKDYIAASCGGTETWKCAGSPGSIDDNCEAVRVCSSDGNCGTAAGTPTPIYPTSNLCSIASMTATPNDTTATDGIYNWTCEGINGGGAVPCSAAKQYTVTFYTNGGTPVGNQSVAYNSTATEPSPAPTKDGYVFGGWYSNDALTSGWNFSTLITGNTSLYAKWGLHTYGVSGTFGANGAGATINGCGKSTTADASGHFSFGSVESGTACDNVSAVLTGYTCTTSRQGPSSLSTDVTDIEGSCTPETTMCMIGHDALDSGIIGSCIIECGIEGGTCETMTYTVTFNTNGGTPVTDQNIAQGANATEPSPAPTKDGYVFGGWYSDAGFTSGWNFSTPITGNTSLYAKWDTISYPPSCSNSIKDGDELGVDCGGSCQECKYSFTQSVKGAAANNSIRFISLGVHNNCVISKVWGDVTDHTSYYIIGSAGTEWTIAILDEGNASTAYAETICNDLSIGGESSTEGSSCGVGGLGIMVGGCCYEGTFVKYNPLTPFLKWYHDVNWNVSNSCGNQWCSDVSLPSCGITKSPSLWPVNCNNGFQDGGETGVDCGGGCQACGGGLGGGGDSGGGDSGGGDVWIPGA
ncbi:MAG: InlB B-repeat-containing protein [Candidatus Gracilibacteria bacterium]|nr:InlB B-repeat-containing protein [Candidatus Gracilibacteria bacterium]